MSAELWFNADTLQDSKLIARLGSSSLYNDVLPGWSINLNADSTITAYLKSSWYDTGAPPAGESLTGGTYVPNAWHYVVFTYDYNDNEMKLYLDGELIGKLPGPAALFDFESPYPIDIGRNGHLQTEYFDGNMSAVRLSSVVRSAKDIYDYYNGSNIKEGR